MSRDWMQYGPGMLRLLRCREIERFLVIESLPVWNSAGVLGYSPTMLWQAC